MGVPRSGRVGMVAAVVGAVLQLAVPTGGAEAANLGTENGITYISESQSTPPNQPSAPTAVCPDGTSLVGTGVDPVAPNNAFGIVASLRPGDGLDGNSRPDDEVTGYAFNPTDMTHSTVTYAMCAPVAVKYPSESRQLASGAAATLKVPCSGGSRVLSGGFYLSAQNQFIHLNTFLPYDDSDGNGRPDDGWKVRAANVGPVKSSFQAWAFCQQDVRPVYPDLSLVTGIGAGAAGGVGSSCPSQEASVIGAAGMIRGAPNARRISGLSLADISGGFEAGDVPDDTVVTDFQNNAASQATNAAFAVCAKVVP